MIMHTLLLTLSVARSADASNKCSSASDYHCYSKAGFCESGQERPCFNGTVCSDAFHKAHPTESPCIDASPSPNPKPTPTPHHKPTPPPTPNAKPTPPTPPPTPHQTPGPPSLARLQSLIKAKSKQWNTSFSVGVHHSATGSFGAAAGLADRGRRSASGKSTGGGTPTTLKSRFPLGSVTKAYTAVAVMRQYELGNLDIDLPIATYVDPILKRDNGTSLLKLWDTEVIMQVTSYINIIHHIKHHTYTYHSSYITYHTNRQ